MMYKYPFSADNWISKCPVTKDTEVILDMAGDLTLKYPCNEYLICNYRFENKAAIKYVIKYGRKTIFEHVIDFKLPGTYYNSINRSVLLRNKRKEYIEKHRQVFESAIEKCKILIERDNIRKCLNKI